MSVDSQRQMELVNQLLQDVFSIVAREANERGNESARDIVMQFLTQFVGTCVLNSLTMPAETAPRGTSASERFSLSWDNYKDEKASIEESIGEGFRMGWKAYSPDADPEMICQVLTITDSPSDPKISH